MNTFDELSEYRFSAGRDYDKKSVEIFRARSLDLVDGLLREITSLRNELSTRTASSSAGAGDGTGVVAETGVPSWLSELEGPQPDAASEIELQLPVPQGMGSELPAPTIFAAVESVLLAAVHPATPALLAAPDDALDTLGMLARTPAGAGEEWGASGKTDSYSSW